MTLPTIEHSARLLRALRRNGIPVFALTNFGREAFAHGRRHHAVLNEFDVAVVSGELGTTKPDPRIYAHLERVTGLSGRALLFADDLPANIATATARGWRTHLFTEPAGWARAAGRRGAARPGRRGLITEKGAVVPL